MYDVIIIGAGPAGTACAYDLANAGCSVLLMDRHRFPRTKACAGGITPKAMTLYPYDISGFVLRTCYKVKVTTPDKTAFFVSDPNPLCFMTRRRDLDAYALKKASQAGAGFLQIENVLCLDQDRNGVTVNALVAGKKEQYRATYLVGADGANSKIRRLVCGKKFRVARCPALEANVRVNRPWDFPMEFDFSKGIAGYYWIFPKDDHVNIGIFGARPHVAMNQGQLRAYARLRLGNDCLEEIKGYPIGVGGGQATAGTGRVLLIGDAAGLAEPLFGEGIYFALKSGQLAANAFLKTFSHGDPLSVYRWSLRQMAVDLFFHRLGGALLYRFPGISLKLGASKLIHGYFSRAYAQGKTISQIFPFL